MILFDGVFGLIALGVWIFCIIDAITTPAERVRNLPKAAWVILVILLVDIGSIAWLAAGRPWDATAARVQRAAAPPRATNPDDDEDFQAQLRRRAEEQRRRAREQQQPPAD